MSNIIELLDYQSILIPEIQRDYAYGRETEKEKAQSFLDAIFHTLVSGEKFRLNYIYGVPVDGNVVLIDGQQRVTTLFLVRLYLAVNAGIKTDFSGNFSYETRTTTKDFCAFLSDEKNRDILKHNLKHNGQTPFSERLYADKGFLKKWRNDPTVYSMIAVLDMIEEKVEEKVKSAGKDAAGLYNNLEKIEFEFITLDGFKREEALYTAMNGRGKVLTKFEQIKAKIFEVINKDIEEIEKNGGAVEELYEDIENKVNNIWTPAFWDYALGDKNNPDYDKAVKHHDKYQFNFFRYVMTMLWCENENNKVEKGKGLPSFDKVLEWILGDGEAEARKQLLFAMESFGDWATHDFEQELSYGKIDDSSGKTNIFWDINEHFDEHFDLIKACCETEELEKYSMLSRCLLWAFIVFEWNKTSNKLNNKTQRDYFVLMRDVYAASWDTSTPTGIDKNPPEHLVAKAIMEFRRIADGDPADARYECQKATFEADNKEKYAILNNVFTRGCSNNLAEIVQQNVQQNGYDGNQAQCFANNLNFLFWHCGIENIKALDAAGLPVWFCNIKKEDRLYLPCTENMLQSLFSMGSWAEDGYRDSSGGKYAEFLDELTKKKLAVPAASPYYTNQADWRYYLENYYESFIFTSSIPKKYFAAFDFTKDRNGRPKFFELTGVAGQRAGKHQTFSPYILAASGYSLENVAEYKEFEDTYKIELEETDGKVELNYDNGTKVKITVLDKTNPSDIVENLKGKLTKLLT